MRRDFMAFPHHEGRPPLLPTTGIGAGQGHGKVDVIAHRRMEFSGYGERKSSEEDSTG
jgi:hypothetical protein